ncbi:hypothetical protein ZWY2020_012375 [Hordeum vulgare]|nr:hypothetical protein ZWY2020_012375 [Hordeum vulgare]
MLARTPSMDDIEARYRDLVLLATAVGDGEEAVTAPALLATMEEHCGVLSTEVTIYVACPPHDLWLLFSTDEKCSDYWASMKIKCCRRWMKFELGERASYGPSSPRKKKTLVYPVICHMKEVIDRGPLLAEDLPADWLPNEGEDLMRKHEFTTVLGKIDGTMYEN